MRRDEFRGPEWITQKLFGGMRSIGLPMKHLMTDGAEYVMIKRERDRTLMIAVSVDVLLILPSIHQPRRSSR